MTPRGRIGTTIREKYRVDKYIATGSMANVYAATHRNGGRVALKILHRELSADASMRERFKREGWFANNIDHPGIAKAIDDDVTEDGCPFIVMDLLEGENLETRRKRLGGRLPLAEVLTVADDVLDVLAAAHAKGVLHRDLKPENVFFTHDGDVKLLDFGVARFDDKKDRSEVTGVGMVLGTPAFMPPEQALGRREEVDARSDLWALGATLFVMLTGESVHTGDTAKAKLLATATSRARKLRDVAPNVPRAVASVIDRALEFDREDRWDDARAMKQALRWARMSLDPEAAVPTSASPDVAGERRTASFAPAPTTKRALTTDDEPTVMRRFPTGDGDPPDSSNDVFTSAPKMPMSLAASSEGPTFSLRNDPVFSLRRAKPFGTPPGDEPTPETQRLPGAAREDAAIPPLVDEPPPSEDVRMEYTRPMMAVPHLRGTLPLPGGPVPLPVNAPPAPPSGAALASPSSGPGLVQQVAPRPSIIGRIAVWGAFVALLGGTVLVLVWKKHEADAARPAPSATAASVSVATTESAAPPVASAPPDPAEADSAIASASATPSASPVDVASAAPSATVVAAKPRPRPKPAPSVTASPSASASAPATAAPSVSESAAPVPIPLPMPVPSPSEGPD